MTAANPVTLPLAGYQARHVRFEVAGKVATLTLDRPDKKNPLTFDSYAEVVDLFRAAAKDKGVKAIVVTGAGQGIGAAYALYFAREGARVVVNDVDAGLAAKVLLQVRRHGTRQQNRAAPGRTADVDLDGPVIGPPTPIFTCAKADVAKSAAAKGAAKTRREKLFMENPSNEMNL